jgi:hypothetical protein
VNTHSPEEDGGTLKIPVAILAGGLATRLRPITEKIPKSLVPVAGRPFLAHQLEMLHARGIRRAVLCIGYLGEMIQREFGDEAFGIQLDYSFDGQTLLGTGGAIKRALPKARPGIFRALRRFVSAGALRAGRGFFPSQRQAGPDDRLSQRGQIRHEQRRFSRRRNCRL